MPRHWLILVLLGWNLSAQADEAFDWLEKMGRAVRDLDYQGIFVYRIGDQLEAMRVLHGTSGGREMERLVSLNGAPREVVRDEHSVLCVLPEQRAVSVGWRSPESSYRAILSRPPEEMTTYYDFALGERERVAGRATRTIKITPRDPFRYGQRIYLDEEYALPLKSELLDRNGDIVSQIMFTQLEVVPELSVDWGVDEESKETQYAWHYQPPAQERGNGIDSSDWSFQRLPSGFRMTVHAHRDGDDKHPNQEHFVFSDGLASFSIYIEEADPTNPLTGGSRVGSMSVFGRTIEGYQVTVVGEVPEATARNVVSAMKHHPQQAAK